MADPAARTLTAVTGPDVIEDSPWALQLAVRVEKTAPPTTDAVCAAAALATIALLDDVRSGPGGPWHDAVMTWNGARIRKLVRRARGSAWQRAQSVDCVTFERAGAEVRAFVPCPMDRAPAEVTKLQIQSTPLDDVDTRAEVPALVAGTLAIGVTPLVEMSWGKQAAQCAHAGQRAWMLANPGTTSAWHAAGRPVAIVRPDAELWPVVVERASVTIHDGGFTEIPAGTNTTVAWWC